MILPPVWNFVPLPKIEFYDKSSFFRNFRTGMEYDLHMISHAYVTYLKRTTGRDPRKPKSAVFVKASKLVRASVKRLVPKQKPLPPPKPSSPIPIQKIKEIPITKKDVVKQPKKKQTSLKKLPSTTLANGQQTSTMAVKEDLTWANCKLKLKMPTLKLTPLKINFSPTKNESKKTKKSTIKRTTTKTTKASVSSARGRKRKAESLEVEEKSPSLSLKIKAKKIQKVRRTDSPKPSTSNYHKNPKKLTIEEKLTCPTCDKIFMAKSILERHLKKSKHGIFAEDKDVSSPPPMISQALDKAMAEGRQLPHWNQVTQPKIEVGGREVNKYECHLCKQVFLRVKDLAKHRERMMCSALLSFK